MYNGVMTSLYRLVVNLDAQGRSRAAEQVHSLAGQVPLDTGSLLTGFETADALPLSSHNEFVSFILDSSCTLKFF